MFKWVSCINNAPGRTLEWDVYPLTCAKFDFAGQLLKAQTSISKPHTQRGTKSKLLSSYWAVKMLHSIFDVIYLNLLRVSHSYACIKLRIRRHYVYFVPVVEYQACKSLVLNIHYFWRVSLPLNNSDRTLRHSLLSCLKEVRHNLTSLKYKTDLLVQTSFS